MISFQIPGEPVAFARSGGNGKIRFTPKKQRDFMALVKFAACQAMKGVEPLDGPVSMTLLATYTPPVSWSKKKREAAKWRTAKPDADNIAKLVADSINEIVFLDDSQIALLNVQKVYGPVAGVLVTVSPLEDA